MVQCPSTFHGQPVISLRLIEHLALDRKVLFGVGHPPKLCMALQVLCNELHRTPPHANTAYAKPGWPVGSLRDSSKRRTGAMRLIGVGTAAFFVWPPPCC